MKLLGYDLTLTRKQVPRQTLSQIPDNRGWINLIRESFAGAWQRNITIDHNLVTSHFAVFACMTLIANDIAKLRTRFLRRSSAGIWEETASSAYDPVMRVPNAVQNRIQFWQNWILSKLMWGNTYALKGRDSRGVVNRLWIMEPSRVQVMVSESGDAFYQLQQDNVSGLREATVAPASAIIHDRMNALFHPLVGLSPIYAAGLAATQGLAIQNNSTNFFTNRSIPGGIITTPNTIPDETAVRLKREWEAKYGASGSDQGGTAILGDGLEFKPMGIAAEDAQLIEQAKATAEWVCSCFHVPPYKIGVGPLPSYANVQALNVEYYSQCLQSLIEEAEECLLNGLEMKPGTKIEFDIENLLRMDTSAQIIAFRDAVSAGVMAPNEARARIDLAPVAGGASPYLQQQNYSLSALAKRDAKPDPFAADKPEPPPQAAPQEDAEEPEDEQQRGIGILTKGFVLASAS